MRGSGSLDVGLPTVIILQVVHALRLPPARVLPLVVEAAGSLAACCKASSPVWTTPGDNGVRGAGWGCWGCELGRLRARTDSELEALGVELVGESLHRGVGEGGRRLQVARRCAVARLPSFCRNDVGIPAAPQAARGEGVGSVEQQRGRDAHPTVVPGGPAHWGLPQLGLRRSSGPLIRLLLLLQQLLLLPLLLVLLLLLLLVVVLPLLRLLPRAVLRLRLRPYWQLLLLGAGAVAMNAVNRQPDECQRGEGALRQAGPA